MSAVEGNNSYSFQKYMQTYVHTSLSIEACLYKNKMSVHYTALSYFINLVSIYLYSY